MLAPALGPVLGGVLLDHLRLAVDVLRQRAGLRARADARRHGCCRATSERRAGQPPRRAAASHCSHPASPLLVYGLAQVGAHGGVDKPAALVGLVGGGALLIGLRRSTRCAGPSAPCWTCACSAPGFATAVRALFFYSVGDVRVLILVPLYDQTSAPRRPLERGLLDRSPGRRARSSRCRWPGGSRTGSAARARDRGHPARPGRHAGLHHDRAPPTPPALLAAALFTVGLGHGLIIPSLAAAPYQGLPKQLIPAATTMSNIVIRVGTSFGVAVLALVLQLRLQAEVPGGDEMLAGVAVTRRGRRCCGARLRGKLLVGPCHRSDGSRPGRPVAPPRDRGCSPTVRTAPGVMRPPCR